MRGQHLYLAVTVRSSSHPKTNKYWGFVWLLLALITNYNWLYSWKWVKNLLRPFWSHFSYPQSRILSPFNLNRKAVHSLVATTVVKVAIPQARQCPVKGPPKGTEALRPPSVCTAPLFFLFYGIVGRSSHWHLKKRNWGGTKCCWGIHPTSKHNTAWQNPCPSQIFWLFDLSFISRLESSIIHY